MVRENIGKYNDMKIVISGRVNKTWKSGHENCMIDNVVIRRDGKKEDHMWVCDSRNENNGIVRDVMMKHQRVGVEVVMRGVIKSYSKRGGVDYCIEQVDMISVDGHAYKKV